MTPRTFWSRALRSAAFAIGILLAFARVGHAQAPDEFHVGDRIALTIEGPQALADTAVVRDGLVLRLPTFGDIPLAGVKRSNIQPYLTEQISKFIKDPVVHAIPLVRVSVLGEVGRPGFYSVPSDMLLSDVVMRAGGPTGNADLSRTVVKRDGSEILSKAQAQAALANGETLDQLQIAPGDEIVVGQRSSFGFGTVLQVFGVAISLAGLLLALSYRHH
jgi:protein involved in polysaccharide export with SLBB domain